MLEGGTLQAVDREALQETLLEDLGTDDVLGGLQLAVFPDEPQEFLDNHLKSAKGAVLASYAGSRKTKGGEAQSNRQLVLDLQVLSPRRTGERGALAYIRRLEALLDGARLVLSDSEGMAQSGYALDVSSDQFLEEHDGVWMYLVKLRCNRL